MRRNREWFRECVALFRQGMSWSDAKALDPVTRIAVLEEYGAQEQAAWDEYERTHPRR